jgi:hypothetical protein
MKPTKRVFYVLALLSGILVIGCSQTNIQTSELLSTKPPTSVATEMPTILLNPTPTNIVDLSNLTTQCVEILDAPSNDVNLRNSLVLSNVSSESYIYNLETGEKRALEITLFATDLIVSPDFQKMAYINYETKELVIKDVNGNEIKTISGFDDHFVLAKWLDNKSLVINKATEDEPLYYHYSLVIFDSETDNFLEFNIADFPNANTYSTGYSYLYPNPQITKMIYLSQDVDKSVILFDMQSKRQLKELYFSKGIPLWARDGDKFAISAVLNFDKYSNFSDDLPYLGGDEIFLVNTDGEMRRLTFLATQYQNNHFSFISWSPTETYMVFNLQNNDEINFGLSILDVNTGNIVNYCIQDTWGYVFWSPDEKQIAFTRWDGLGSSKAEVYILDLEKNLVFKVAHNTMVAGWMIINKE